MTEAEASRRVTHIRLGTTGVAAVRAVMRTLAREHVDILQAFLLGAQIYALPARLFRRNVKLIAAIRSSMGPDQIVGWKGKLSHVLVFRLRGLVDQYVFNSSAGERTLGRKLSATRKRVIFNGIDTVRFRPDARGPEYLREVAEVPAGSKVIGIVANVNVDKGFETLVRSAAIVTREVSDVCFVVIGEHRNSLGDRIRGMIAALSLTGAFRLLGLRRDVERLVPGLDILCSASTSEGFSNSIGEAMACGVPCVVTAVGDSSWIVGETGVSVPPNDPAALAEALLQLLRLDRDELTRLGEAARARIEQFFSVRQMIEHYESLYESLLQRKSQDRSA